MAGFSADACVGDRWRCPIVDMSMRIPVRIVPHDGSRVAILLQIMSETIYHIVTEDKGLSHDRVQNQNRIKYPDDLEKRYYKSTSPQ